MGLKISARNFSLSRALRDLAEERYAKLSRFSHHIIDMNLIMEKEKSLGFIELTVAIKKGFLRADIRTGDMYHGVNVVFNKVEKQLKKHEEKLRERKRLAHKTRGRI